MLYFANRSADTSDVYLADGLTEGIITRLARDARLTVKSTAAVERLRGRSAPPDSAGRALRVANLVNGTVARSGRRLRVSAELVRASTGVTVWAGQFDRADADLFDIQTAIADTIAREIVGRLLPGPRTARSRPTESADAYDRFLQGNYRLARRTPEDVRLAIRQYEEAVAMDPGFAAAHARIALAYGVTLDWGWPSFDVQTSIRAGLAASGRALELDSMLADAWTARGYMLKFANARTFAGVREAFARAVRLAPRDAEAHLQYGWALAGLGDTAAAATVLRHAVALDPERAISRFTLAFMLTMYGRASEALLVLDTGIAVDPTAAHLHGMRAWVLLVTGDFQRAAADISAERNDAQLMISATVALRARSGDTTGALNSARGYAGYWPAAPARLTWAAGWAAMALASAGAPDEALDMLERIEPQGIPTWSLMQFPGFDPIRNDARFQRLMRDLAPPRR